MQNLYVGLQKIAELNKWLNRAVHDVASYEW